MSRHPSMDVLCASSGLKKISPGRKFSFALYCMVLSIAGKNPWMGFFLAALLSGITLLAGKISLGNYLRLLSVPFGFLIVSCITLLIDMGQCGLWHGSLLGVNLCITKTSLSQAILVLPLHFYPFFHAPLHENCGQKPHGISGLSHKPFLCGKNLCKSSPQKL